MLLGGATRWYVERQATTSRASAKAPDDGAQPASTEGVAESAASGREERNQQPAAVAVAATSSIRSAADAAAAEDGGAVSAAAAELQQQGAEPTAKLLPKRGVKQLLSHGLSRQVATCHAAVTESYLAKEMWVKPAKRGGRGPRTVPLKALIDLPEVRALQRDSSLSDEEKMHWGAFVTCSLPHVTKSVVEYLEGHMGLTQPDEPVDVGWLLREGLPEDPPLRPYLEEFVILEGDPRQRLVGRLGLRVKPSHTSPIPACTFLGFYGGTLRTVHEFEALLDHRIKNELGRHRRKLLLETYASDICAEEAALRCDWKEAVTSSKIEVDFDLDEPGGWHFIVSGAEGGNGTSLLNDPNIDPRSCKPQDYDRPGHVVGGGANCKLFQVAVGPWVYLGVATTREVMPGSELLYSYTRGQWRTLKHAEADAEDEEEKFGPASILPPIGTAEFARWEEAAGPALVGAAPARNAVGRLAGGAAPPGQQRQQAGGGARQHAQRREASGRRLAQPGRGCLPGTPGTGTGAEGMPGAQQGGSSKRRTRAYTPQDKEWLRSQHAARRATAAGAATAAGGMVQAGGAPGSAAGSGGLNPNSAVGGRIGSGGKGIVRALQLADADSDEAGSAAAAAAVPGDPTSGSLQPAAAAAPQAGQQMLTVPSSHPIGADVAPGPSTARGQKRKSRSPEPAALAAAASPAAPGGTMAGTAVGTAVGTAPAVATLDAEWRAWRKRHRQAQEAQQQQEEPVQPQQQQQPVQQRPGQLGEPGMDIGPGAPAATTPAPPSRPAVAPLGAWLASGRHSARSSRHVAGRLARGSSGAEESSGQELPAAAAMPPSQHNPAPQQQQHQQRRRQQAARGQAAAAGAGATPPRQPGRATAAAATAGSPGGVRSPLRSPGGRQQTLAEAFQAAAASAAAAANAGAGGAGAAARAKEGQHAAPPPPQQQQGAGGMPPAKRPRQAAPARQPASLLGAVTAAGAGGAGAQPLGATVPNVEAAAAAGGTAVLSPAGWFRWGDETGVVDLVGEEPPLAPGHQHQQQQHQQQQGRQVQLQPQPRPPQRRPLPPVPADDEVIDLTLDDD